MGQVNLERNAFIRGLITEASPLTFPENASIDEDNFVLERTGLRKRRLGVDYELNNAMLDSGYDFLNFKHTAVTGYRWENVNNDPAITITVVQVGKTLWFLDGFASTLSTNVLGSVIIGSTPVSIALSAQNLCQFASLNGSLIVVNPKTVYPIKITYDGSTFTKTDLVLKVRDIWGIDDSLEIEDQPYPIDIKHEYNLFNQGWPVKKVECDTGTTYPHDRYNDVNTKFPSNVDIWHVAKDANNKFTPSLLDSADIGTREAAKGRVIINAFSRGNSRREFMTANYDTTETDSAVKSLHPTIGSSSSVTEIPLDYEASGVSTVTSYAGRIFFSGIDSEASATDDNSPLHSSTIFFTQIVNKDSDFEKCHSVNDPSSDEFSEVLATDGGTITIPEATRIFRLINKDTSLVVIAENGIWEITGPDGVFRADDYSIRQVTNIGATNAASVVNAEGNVFYWSKAGIYALTPDNTLGRLSPQNMTESTIQTFYTSISSIGRTNAVGRYDSDGRKLTWLYNDSDSYDGVTQKNKYNRELTYDLTIGAFYPFTFGEVTTDSSYIAGYAATGGFNVTDDVQQVVVNGVPVQVNGEDVVITSQVRGASVNRNKYITIKPNSTGNVTFTFSLYNDDTYVDWSSDDGTGIDAAAYMITGYELFQDSARRKQVTYLTMHFKMTETALVASGTDLDYDYPSSCLVQSRWDWANSGAAGKFGTQFQAYKLPRLFTGSGAGAVDLGHEVITTKNKLRGIGRSFSMRIDTEAGKDLQLYGWALNVEGTPIV